MNDRGNKAPLNFLFVCGVCVYVRDLWSSHKCKTQGSFLSCLSLRTALEGEMGVNKEERGLKRAGQSSTE